MSPAENAPARRPGEFEPLPLALYAQIKFATWGVGQPLKAVLEQFGIEELRWRQHEVWQRARLADEATGGSRKLAQAVTAALGEARRARELALRPTVATRWSIERFAEVRIGIENAGPGGDLAWLTEHGIDLDAWAAERASWSDRTKGDVKLAGELRALLAAGRRAHAARKRLAADTR
ncbi:MAG: hypothetical protein EXR75_10330 [Myxococcales bacterium]|nr:hypothetical protein [Myxococcales bacterium]